MLGLLSLLPLFGIILPCSSMLVFSLDATLILRRSVYSEFVEEDTVRASYLTLTTVAPLICRCTSAITGQKSCGSSLDELLAKDMIFFFSHCAIRRVELMYPLAIHELYLPEDVLR
jgi:hypothetical protein